MATDEELMLSVGRGNLDDFESIVRRNQRLAWSIAYRYLNDAQEAEDVVQEAFLRILHAAPAYRSSASFSTYLYRVVANLCLDSKKKLHPVYMDSPPAPDSASPGPVDHLLTQEQEHLVRQALAALPPQPRMAVILRYYEDLGYREVAEILQVSEKAVERLLARGRELLKKSLVR